MPPILFYFIFSFPPYSIPSKSIKSCSPWAPRSSFIIFYPSIATPACFWLVVCGIDVWWPPKATTYFFLIFMRAQNPCLGRAWWAFLIASIKKKEKMCHMTLTGRRCGTGVLSDLVDVVLSFLGERLTAPGHFFAFFRRM